MILNHKLFKNVPEYQYNMLKDFIEIHPYKKIMHNDLEHEYLLLGRGKQAIVLLHGAMFNPYMWFYIMGKFKNDFNIIAPKFPTIGMGAKESADFIKEVLDIERIEKAIIVGYSYGGGVAQYFAEVYPEYINVLVLSNTGTLRRENSIAQTKKMIKMLPFLPGFTIDVIKNIRTRSGKDSEWFHFRKAFFNMVSESITKKVFIDHFKKNLDFLKEIDYLPIGKASWKGKTILLATKSDMDTYPYFEDLKEIYDNNISYVFEESGGHHMIFLFPEKYTQVLRKNILELSV